MNVQINIEPGLTNIRLAAHMVRCRFAGWVCKVQVQNSTYIDDGGETARTKVLVVKVSSGANGPMFGSAVSVLCTMFKEDCAAVRWPDGTGELVGPQAAKWGAFNPDFFLEYDDELAEV